LHSIRWWNTIVRAQTADRKSSGNSVKVCSPSQKSIRPFVQDHKMLAFTTSQAFSYGWW
jgi:hypothetical protein